MKDPVTWETVNSYVDGELSATQAAEVAKAVAINPRLADRVAMLSSLKAVIAHSTDGLRRDIKFDGTKPARSWALWAAGLAAVLVLGTLFSVLVMRSSFVYPVSGVRIAGLVHTEWLTSQTVPRGTQHPEFLQTALDGIYVDAYVPDLSKVDLTFSGIRRLSASDIEGLHVGYAGPRGCMVSLVVIRNHIQLSSRLSLFQDNGQSVYGWRVGTTGFYLLAHKMDPQRLATVANVVHGLTRSRLPLDSQAVIVLNDARASSQPCVA